MAVWTILYGAVQGAAPRLLRATSRSESDLLRQARLWVGCLIPVPVALAVAVHLAGGPSDFLTAFIISGLLLFGGVFAVNSSLHSYLILSFTDATRVTMDVGFY